MGGGAVAKVGMWEEKGGFPLGMGSPWDAQATVLGLRTST